MSIANEPQHFDTFSKLPPALVTTSIQVTKFSGSYVKFGSDQEIASFDWISFKAAIDAYKADDLSFDKFKNTTIARSESTVNVMADKIAQFLLEALSVIIDKKELAATIEATFTNLKSASSNGWADFNKSSTYENSSWEYRVLFSVPNPDLADWFYTLVTTIKLEADIQDESSWWGLVSSSSHNFSAEISAMELIVQKGFKNPN
ncbi:delta-endotoxin CytB [Obba rivulosa]|uniref:Delta-endotoxin CytB n=1 Tax=Obba rivulosa TaxID=1052685 RepID=A0A8E2AQ47_9APHY|nr:delta-endotoxin CytB [Obba rivulosa]